MSRPSRDASLAQWLAWQEQLHPRAIDLGLERVMRVLARTGWRRPRAPVITVGGTNGKGSCVALLEAMLAAGGYRVGVFTSPHLVDYTERVRLDGRNIAAESLVAAFERIADALEGDSLTFFEFNTLAALLVFETAQPDAIVLEVGMGGRLDAVNVVDADVAVVVSVGLDHMEWLGADVEAIGREKGGIFRRARPAVIGTLHPPESLLACAQEQGARLKRRGVEFEGLASRDAQDAAPRAMRWAYRGPRWQFDDLPQPALAGAVQIGNAATALAVLEELQGRLPLDRAALERGLAAVRLSGRFERRNDAQGREWVLDVAHNPDAAAILAANLQRYPARGRTLAVCGMLADKDVVAVLNQVRACADRWIAASTDGPRGLDARALAELAEGSGIAMEDGGSIAQAMDLAARVAAAGDRIVVFGSFHTVGPALEQLAVLGVSADESNRAHLY